MAYSEEQRRSALETFIRFDHSYADTIAELGYPNRTLRGWWREYERTGVVPVRKSVSDPTYTDAMKRAAVDYDPSAMAGAWHGRRGRSAIPRAASCSASGSTNMRRARGNAGARARNSGPVPLERKVQVVAELEARTGTAAEVAERNGVSRTAPYAWRRKNHGP